MKIDKPFVLQRGDQFISFDPANGKSGWCAMLVRRIGNNIFIERVEYGDNTTAREGKESQK